MENNVEDLANRLNEYSEKFDHYDYYDQYENNEEGYNDVLKTLNTDLKGIESICKKLHNDSLNDEREDIKKEALDLLKDIELYKNSFVIKNYNIKEKFMENEKKSIYVTIPESVISDKEFVQQDKNGKEHTYLFINLPHNEDDNVRKSFAVIKGQIVNHPTIAEFRNIPISDYGVNLNVSTKVGEEWKKEVQHLTQEEAVKLVSDMYYHLNDKESKFLKLPEDKVTKIQTKEGNECFSVKLPSYMTERDGFKFGNASLYCNKAYTCVSDDDKKLLAIPCYDQTKEGKDISFKVSNYGKDIYVKPSLLHKYNIEDYSNYIKAQRQDKNKESVSKEKSAEEPSYKKENVNKHENSR